MSHPTEKTVQTILNSQCDETGRLAIGMAVWTGTEWIAKESEGLKNPYHDEEIIDESGAPATIVITYKLNGATVGTKTISVSGTTTTITIT